MQMDEGYTIVEDRSISLARANLLVGVATLPAALILLACAWLLTRAATGLAPQLSLAAIAGTLVAAVPGIFLHEAMHGVVWQVLGRLGPGKVRYGFHRATLTPYAHALEPMSVSAYRAGAAAPGLMLGALPFAAGIFAGSLAMALFGILFITAAGGDGLVLWLLRDARGEALALDHPSRAGCLLVERVRSPGSDGERQVEGREIRDA